MGILSRLFRRKGLGVEKRPDIRLRIEIGEVDTDLLSDGYTGPRASITDFTVDIQNVGNDPVEGFIILHLFGLPAAVRKEKTEGGYTPSRKIVSKPLLPRETQTYKLRIRQDIGRALHVLEVYVLQDKAEIRNNIIDGSFRLRSLRREEILGEASRTIDVR